MSKNLFHLYNILFPFSDFLYVLQLEEYDSARFAKILRRFFIRRKIQKRDTLKLTSRVQTTYFLSVVILILSLAIFLLTNRSVFIIVVPLLVPFYILISNILLTPFYEFMKLRLQSKAKNYVRSHKKMTVIAIAGSYGKTTTKTFLYELLKYDFNAQMIPGNINTPTGIASWVLKDLNLATEILLVEMDTYFRGEIERSCLIVNPNISIVTSIGDQHVERFGSIRNMTEAILEVFKFADTNAKLYMLKEDFEKCKQLKISVTKNINLVTDNTFDIKTNIVSESAKKDLKIALSVAENFNLSPEIKRDTLMHLSHPDRRQKITSLHGYIVIDDSYNISFTTASAAVSELKRIANKRNLNSIVITAGIPELGTDNRNANNKYRDLLVKNVDHIIILNSIYAPDLMNDKFFICNDLEQAWKYIKTHFDKKNSIILVQPELTDIYYNS